jgi:hypothetical protein
MLILELLKLLDFFLLIGLNKTVFEVGIFDLCSAHTDGEKLKRQMLKLCFLFSHKYDENNGWGNFFSFGLPNILKSYAKSLHYITGFVQKKIVDLAFF